jgi:spore coat polysaccharide biosynthesis protein SpsF
MDVKQEDNQWGIIIQARTGSTRLPSKMLLPLGNQATLLNVIISNLQAFFSSDKIVLATTISPKDDPLVTIGKQAGVIVFRGSENDVLSRFIEAARQENWTRVVRVCADNPFLYGGTVLMLVENALRSNADYVSWFFKDGLPAIRSHSGFFPEWVTLKALEKIAGHTQQAIYREHVTNFIYDHAQEFIIRRIAIEDESFFRTIRLTVDTESDYTLLKAMYEDLSLSGRNITPERLKKYIDERPELKSQMKINITKNEK